MDSICQIYKVIAYMNEHISEELSLDILCSVSGFTKSYLCYIFRLYIGVTPIKYFYRQRLKYGANLLFGNENILDVAVKIGYGSHEAFSRAFKKEFGMTPAEYRQMSQKGLKHINELDDVELTFVFAVSPSYRRFLGLDQYGKHYDVYQSLIKKGYINEHDLECTVEGKQLSDKYYWDCSNIIIKLSEVYNTLSELYENTIKLIYIPKLLFYQFVYGLTELELIKNFFLGSCGSNCLTCKTLRATLEDDDDLRKSEAAVLKEKNNINMHYSQMNCFGCTSGDRLDSCAANCPWQPCCKQNSVIRCNQCKKYPCDKISELFNHMPEFAENFK